MSNQLSLWETIRQVGNIAFQRHLTGGSWQIVRYGKGWNQYDVFTSFAEACKLYIELTEK
jgi:hypothetical protein